MLHCLNSVVTAPMLLINPEKSVSVGMVGVFVGFRD